MRAFLSRTALLILNSLIIIAVVYPLQLSFGVSLSLAGFLSVFLFMIEEEYSLKVKLVKKEKHS